MTIRFKKNILPNNGTTILLAAIAINHLVLLLLPGTVACAEPPLWSCPPLEQSLSIRDGHTGKRLSFAELLNELKLADTVFLGESHTDETTHRFQLAVYQELLKLKGQKVVLALEMFERDVQDQLNAYLSGKIEEASFLKKARPWANYHEAYRPLVEQAKTTGSPVVAANFPIGLRRRMAREGQEILHALSDKEKRQVPKQYHPNTPAYWKRTDNATRGHQGMMPVNSDDPLRLYSTQSLWDNSMGEACADALDKYPGHSVLHLNGNFHSSYWDGTTHQLRLRKPSIKIKTVSIVPTLYPNSAKPTGKKSADYIVYVEARATNVDGGERSVIVGSELKYRFHLPATASKQTPSPLLIWLSEDGLTAQEGMDFCRLQFGESAAIAVIEAPYKALGEDYSVGGQWFWADTFAGNTGTLVSGVERIGAYLLRHFPIDAKRVSIVGEGAGATVASVVAVHSNRLQLAAIAINPRQYSKVKDLPLPLPEYYGEDPPPSRTLTVFAASSQEAWWQKEITQYNQVKVSSDFKPSSNDPWERDLQILNAIRTSLSLPTLPTPTGQEQQYLLINADSSRARHWGRLHACSISRQNNSHVVAVVESPENAKATEVQVDITPKSALQAGLLPKCPGPFGGTTVVVLPEETPEADVAKWLAVEASDPLAAASRFHRVRIATKAGVLSLPKVLEKLRSENRKNILIVPATFYANGQWLRRLNQSVQNFEDQMTLHWLPGLGGQLDPLNSSK